MSCKNPGGCTALLLIVCPPKPLQGWLSPAWKKGGRGWGGARGALSSSPLPHSQVFQLLDAGCRDNARAPPQRGSCFHLQRWVLGEEGGERFAWVPWSLLMFSSKAHLSWSLSLSGCLAAIHSSSPCHCVCFSFPAVLFVEVCWSPGELKAQAEVMGQFEGKLQQKLHISLLNASQVHTPGAWCTVLFWMCKGDAGRGRAWWERSCQKRGKD